MGYERESDIRDPFYYRQPSASFIEDLQKPYHTVKPDWFCRKNAAAGEADAGGAYIHNRFDDPEKREQYYEFDERNEEFTLPLPWKTEP